jgi:hypothetical protein
MIAFNKTIRSLFFFSFLLIFFSSSAQHIAISPVTGYATGTHLKTDLGNLRISDGLVIGAALDASIGHGKYAQLSISHLGSSLDLDGGFTQQRICNLSINYYSVGYMQEFKPDATLSPFGLLGAGLVNYNPVNDGISSTNRLHLALAGGIRYKAGERTAIRIQGRLLMPFFAGGSYFSKETGAVGYGIPGGMKGVCIDFTAALVINLWKPDSAAE